MPADDYQTGDVVEVRDVWGDKRSRPAAVVSSATFHRDRLDIVVIGISTEIRPDLLLGVERVRDLQSAGLIHPSVIKPILATIPKDEVIRPLGKLSTDDKRAAQQLLKKIFGATGSASVHGRHSSPPPTAPSS